MIDTADVSCNYADQRKRNNGLWHCVRLVLQSCMLLTMLTGISHAASKIYITNETGLPLHVKSVSVSGAALSKKAWKAGADLIEPGERAVILSINRTGKFNWMDPTPRFIEPGKTAFFTSNISVDKDSDESLLIATQKLTGTGSGSKMWHRVEGTKDAFDWTLDNTEFTSMWSTAADHTFSVVYRTFKQDKDTHVEYIISPVQ